jgi:hypothetical protein
MPPRITARGVERSRGFAGADHRHQPVAPWDRVKHAAAGSRFAMARDRAGAGASTVREGCGIMRRDTVLDSQQARPAEERPIPMLRRLPSWVWLVAVPLALFSPRVGASSCVAAGARHAAVREQLARARARSASTA